MNTVLADTSYYLALFSPDDVHHTQADRLSKSLRPRIVVTDFILCEIGNALSRRNSRRLFVELISSLRSDPDLEIVPASADLFERGFELYARRADKEWSMTDCISFVVMQQYELDEALTADHHFEQAGFTILLK
jgi:predicted nucleic acid-binding protein